MPDGYITLECQKCSTRYNIPSIEEMRLCNICGSGVQTIKYGRASTDPIIQPSPLTIKRRKENTLMAKAKIVKMPTATAKKKASKKVAKNPAVGRKFKGSNSGLSVLAYQNKTLIDNRKAKLSDKKLAKAWRDEFPNAKAYTEKVVDSVRRAFNRGKHGNETPARPIPEFDASGNPIKKEKAVEKKDKKTVKKAVKKKATKKRQVVEDDDDDEDDEDDLNPYGDDDEE